MCIYIRYAEKLAGSRQRYSKRVVNSRTSYWVAVIRIGEANNPGPTPTFENIGKGDLILETANRSGNGSYVEYAERTDADILFGQETMSRGDAFKKMVNKLRKGRRKVVAIEGIDGPSGGDSCDTAMVFPNWIDIKPPSLDEVDDKEYGMAWKDYVIAPGRIVAASVNRWGPFAVLMSSVYLDTRDGDGPLNRLHLLQRPPK